MCGCRYGGCIPQRRYDCPKNDPISDSERGALITFSVNGKCGFPVRSALEKRYAGLDGRDDLMFVGFKLAVSVRFEVRGLCAFYPNLDAYGYLYGSGRPTRNGRTRFVYLYSPIGETDGDH